MAAGVAEEFAHRIGLFRAQEDEKLEWMNVCINRDI
jgi:hypothetical protein